MPKESGPKSDRLTNSQLEGLEEITNDLGYATLKEDLTDDTLSGINPDKFEQASQIFENAEPTDDEVV